MRILVTGSEGSLMQAVIPQLLAAGHEVVGVDSFVRYGRIERERHYTFLEGDLSDPAISLKAIEGCDGVIQAAARIYGVIGFHQVPADILGYDLALHHNVLRAALHAEVGHVAYISSSMVYERVPQVPCTESDVDEAPPPSTAYGLSKLTGERMSQAFWQQYQLPYTIWRPFNIITGTETAAAEVGISHVFADFVERIVLNPIHPLPIIGGGEQVRCFTWIDDVARGIADHTFTPAARNETFNLGNPEPMTMKALARRIRHLAREAGLLPDGPDLAFTSMPAPSDDVRRRVPDVRKAKALLDWEPTVSTDESLQRVLSAVARNRSGRS
ncbi:MAG: NAD-dependent epimerase/dehydratase family protein [Candidatus Sericytochromatia bacterium]|nr:NAD-dependent epimerase/dehydratase family protein [Candidatus Sericytochromatia bacterium]